MFAFVVRQGEAPLSEDLVQLLFEAIHGEPCGLAVLLRPQHFDHRKTFSLTRFARRREALAAAFPGGLAD